MIKVLKKWKMMKAGYESLKLFKLEVKKNLGEMVWFWLKNG